MPVGPSGASDLGPDAALIGTVRLGFSECGGLRVGVAVSGGGDSMALLHLMHRTALGANCTLFAVTVDHALRLDSAAEARDVARFCQALGVPHTTLRWDHGAVSGNLMDAARQARMRLMSDWAAGMGIAHIALGHTADDQAETFLMGLGRASGLDGLVGMRAVWLQDGITWSRPMLNHSRADLRAYLLRAGVAWVDDPTNSDDRFTRIKARKAMAALAPLGITAQSLTTSMAHLQHALQAVQQAVHRAVKADVAEVAGGLTIARKGYDAQPSDVQRRVLVAAIGWMSGSPYPPRKAAQVTLQLKTAAGLDSTLQGCRFQCKGDVIHIIREPKAAALHACASDQVWDHRWCVAGPHAPDLTLRALGAEGLRFCKNWRDSGISRDVLLVSPAIWRGDALISAPLAGFNPEWQASIPNGFHKFILSH